MKFKVSDRVICRVDGLDPFKGEIEHIYVNSFNMRHSKYMDYLRIICDDPKRGMAIIPAEYCKRLIKNSRKLTVGDRVKFNAKPLGSWWKGTIVNEFTTVLTSMPPKCVTKYHVKLDNGAYATNVTESDLKRLLRKKRDQVKENFNICSRLNYIETKLKKIEDWISAGIK